MTEKNKTNPQIIQWNNQNLKLPLNVPYASPWKVGLKQRSYGQYNPGDREIRDLASRLVLLESEKGFVGWSNKFNQWIRDNHWNQEQQANKKLELKKEVLRIWSVKIQGSSHENKTFKPLWNWMQKDQLALQEVWQAIWIECLLDMEGDAQSLIKRVNKIEEGMKIMSLTLDWKEWEKQCIEDLKDMEQKEFDHWVKNQKIDEKNMKDRSAWQDYQEKKVLPFLGIQAMLDLKMKRSPEEKNQMEQQWMECVWVEWEELSRRKRLGELKPHWKSEDIMSGLEDKVHQGNEQEIKKIEWQMKKVEFRWNQYEKMHSLEKRLSPNDWARWMAWWQEKELKRTLHEHQSSEIKDQKEINNITKKIRL